LVDVVLGGPRCRDGRWIPLRPGALPLLLFLLGL